MDLYSIYRKNKTERLRDHEVEYLEKIADEYPFFTLPHYLKARHNPSQENIFTASAYSVNRKLLKKYLEGKLFFTDLPSETKKEDKSESSPVMLPDPQYRKPLHHLFTILNFEEEGSTHTVANGLFSLAESKVDRSAWLPFLDWNISVLTQKYSTLGKRMPELMIPISPGNIEISETASQLEAEEVIETKVEERKNIPSEKDDENHANSLIDRFLANHGDIKRKAPKSRFGGETPSVVTESVTEDEDLVTETLARLHLLQNNPDEAIRIYQKLRLLFPEKSAYFDAQINKIKET